MNASDRIGLPAPVARWVRMSPPRTDAPRSIYLEGPARFKRGRLPYFPLEIRTWNRLGFDRVSELEVRIAGLTVMHGLDAYVDGHGFTRIGSDLSTGPSVDQGAFHVMFLETLLVPAAWPDAVRWEPIDRDSAQVITPFGADLERAVVTFDPESGYPRRYRTDRYKGSSPTKMPWTASVSAWRTFPSLVYPTLVEAAWADEAQPWLRMHIAHASADPEMAEPLARARAVLADQRVSLDEPVRFG